MNSKVKMTDIFTTETRKYHTNGNLAFESVHVGEFVVVNEWHSNGVKSRECMRRLGSLDFVGVRREFRPNGKMWCEMRYNEDGTLRYNDMYDENQHITWEMVYMNGKIVKESTFRDGILLTTTRYT